MASMMSGRVGIRGVRVLGVVETVNCVGCGRVRDREAARRRHSTGLCGDCRLDPIWRMK